MNIEDYKPINWNIWMEGWKDGGKGRGQNIKPLLEDRFWEFWKLIPFYEDIKNSEEGENLPAQDARTDPGHGEIVSYFSDILCKILNGNFNVVIPGAMFHDTGYKISGEEHRKAFLSIPKNEQEEREQKLIQRIIRLEHQVRGAYYAYNFLKRMGWPIEYIAEIQSIIADHDTRILETTKNGKIMQDADILWRFTLGVMEEYYDDIIKKHGSLLNYMENEELSKPDRFNFPIAREIAKLELVNTLYKSPWRKDSLENPEIRRHVEENYPRELERVVQVYS